VGPATRFYPVDAYGKIPNINGAALTGGNWERVYIVLNASAGQDTTISATVGMDRISELKFGDTIS